MSKIPRSTRDRLAHERAGTAVTVAIARHYAAAVLLEAAAVLAFGARAHIGHLAVRTEPVERVRRSPARGALEGVRTCIADVIEAVVRAFAAGLHVLRLGRRTSDRRRSNFARVARIDDDCHVARCTRIRHRSIPRIRRVHRLRRVDRGIRRTSIDGRSFDRASAADAETDAQESWPNRDHRETT